jgi:hypothetical protein
MKVDFPVFFFEAEWWRFGPLQEIKDFEDYLSKNCLLRYIFAGNCLGFILVW